MSGVLKKLFTFLAHWCCLFFYLYLLNLADAAVCLDEKSNKKIKPPNKKLKNYLETSFRAPNRSS
jgi:hypothetical protein